MSSDLDRCTVRRVCPVIILPMRKKPSLSVVVFFSFQKMKSYELKRREADIKRQRQMDDGKRKARESEGQQRREIEKVKQHEDGTYYFIHANFTK